MIRDWRLDLSVANRAFINLVWPEVAARCGDGELLPVESLTPTATSHMLDTVAGIDFWQKRDNGTLVRGIAVRVQAAARSYDTFTVRRARFSGAVTEYEKRCKALDRRDDGYIYPGLTIHAYVTSFEGTGILIAAGIVRTIDLYGFLRDGYGYTDETDNATFFVARWDELKQSGYRVGVIRPRRLRVVA